MNATSPFSIAPALPPRLGQLVLYHEGQNPPRVAIIGNVHEDATTVDLVVLLDGDARRQETRTAWAMGSGVVRVRTAILHKSDDPKGVRHWTEGADGETLREELALLVRALEAVGLLRP